MVSDGGLFTDVDTVKELTDILVFDSSRLLDTSGVLRDEFQIVSFNNKLILLLGGHVSSDSFWELDTTDDLFSQEVTDLENII